MRGSFGRRDDDYALAVYILLGNVWIHDEYIIYVRARKPFANAKLSLCHEI
jgi:hypothetical protein